MRVSCIAEEKQEKYTFKVEGIQGNACISFDIVFIDDLFERCTFAYRGTYSREQWKLLAKIEEAISEIEHEKGIENG